MVRKTLAFIDRHRLLNPSEAVLVGLSGGPDSVALCLVLHELSSSGKLPLRITLAHLNHLLRDEESDRDEEFCRSFAGGLDLPVEVDRADVAEQAERAGRSLEAAAREARYRFLVETARKRGIDRIATAHHGDDVAETVLMRIIRGCGIDGLGAVEPERPADPDYADIRLVRPFLDCEREDILDYLAERGQPCRRDTSNEDTRFLRNRVRHELIPRLREEYGGFSVRSVCALNRAAVEVGRLLEEMVDEKWPELCTEREERRLGLDARLFAELRPAERKAAVRRAVALLAGRPGAAPALKALHYEQAGRLGEAAVGKAVSLPHDLTARREHGVIVFEGRAGGVSIPRRELPVQGQVSVPEVGLTIAAETLPAGSVLPEQAAARAGPDRVFLDRASMGEPLFVRGRRPGDVFHPLGAPGAKKLKDFLIDRKVPRHRRDRLPLVVTAEDEIAWVAGVEIGHPFRLTGGDSEVLRLSVERTDG